MKSNLRATTLAVGIMSFVASRFPAAADTADPLLQALIGQTCSHDSGQSKVVYTIDQKNGQWAVHDLYAATHTPEALMRDVGWVPAKVSGATLSFQGETATIKLTAIDSHSVQANFSSTMPSRPGTSEAILDCAAAPPEKRWR